MKKRVALLVETSSSYGRNVLSGIGRYMRIHPNWSVFLEQRALEDELPGWLMDWQGDGIISRSSTPQLIAQSRKQNVPLVELTDRNSELLIPHVRSDDDQIGQLAAEHLIERGFRNFGFVGFEGEAWSMRREQAFQKAVGNDSVSVFRSVWAGLSARPWPEQQAALSEWLEGLEHPVGIMACNDLRAQQVLDACQFRDIAVPEEVAVVGVDNDEVLCQICNPPLSSVIPNAHEVGFRAAETLQRLIDGKELEERESLVPPLGLAARASSDVIAIPDVKMSRALQIIREMACSGVSVEEVARLAGTSRSTLERKARKFLGVSPQEHIRRVQIRRAKELLMTSEMSVEQIARLTGFEHVEYLHVLFKKHNGISPGQFRKRGGNSLDPQTMG